ncbi:hypothetical protein GCM10010256_77310 [Streptomyces coeruleorubidus]|nr:hypothetical protein GCM10010256_77310 [Streptomyces coeruleorubidus]
MPQEAGAQGEHARGQFRVAVQDAEQRERLMRHIGGGIHRRSAWATGAVYGGVSGSMRGMRCPLLRFSNQAFRPAFE